MSEKEFTVAMELERETKGTYRYETDSPVAPINPLYVRKFGFGDRPAPKKITITVKYEEET